jgi:hypothetical protein
MQIITIERSVSFDDLDRYYRRLADIKDVDAPVELLVPRILYNNYMGLSMALLQFVVSWIRHPRAGKLMFDISNPETQDWEEIFKEEHIFPIIALAVNTTGVYDEGGVSLIPYIRNAYAKVRGSMVKVKPLMGG